MQYEDGQMNREETIEFFQELVNSGMAWTLQGQYGRMAMALIKAGLVTMPKIRKVKSHDPNHGQAPDFVR